MFAIQQGLKKWQQLLLIYCKGAIPKRAYIPKQNIRDNFMVYGDDKWGRTFEIRATLENLIAYILQSEHCN